MELSSCSTAFDFSFSVHRNFLVFHFLGSICEHCCHPFCSLSYFSLILLARNRTVICVYRNWHYDDDTFSVSFCQQSHFPMASAMLVCVWCQSNHLYHSNISNWIDDYAVWSSSSARAYSNDKCGPVFHSIWIRRIIFCLYRRLSSYCLSASCRNSDSVVILW